MLTLLGLIALPWALTASSPEGQLRLNELMPSNIDCLMTDHEFPDSWVELHNPSEGSIDLYHYQLGESRESSEAYRFDEHLKVPGGGYQIVCCDKVGQGLHTDFRLSASDTARLYLFDPQGLLIDSITYPTMPAPNLSFGRTNDDDWRWQIFATPGALNHTAVADSLLPKPRFSHKGGIFTEPLTVTIGLPDKPLPADTRIYITTDGSEPDRTSRSDTAFTFSIQSSTVIRAKLLSDSALCRRSTTRSYIFHPRATELPILSMVTDKEYLYGSAEGILSGATTEGKPNYEYDWRRPVNIEYLGTAGDEPLFNQLAETAVAGSATRKYLQKSLKLYAHKRFGDKRFKGPLWADKPELTKVETFVLRNGGNNVYQARINDALLQRLFGTHISDIDYLAYTPAIVYINGRYEGLVGLRERSNEDYIASNYGIPKDSLLMADNVSYLFREGEGGSNPNFTPVYDAYHRDDVTFDELAALIDVDNLIHTTIADIFPSNTDYPHNNVVMWRTLDPDSRWRWVLKDVDFFAYNEKTPLEFNMFRYLFGPVAPTDMEYTLASRQWTSLALPLYQRMITFDEFREPLISTFAVWLGDFLKPSVTLPMIDVMSEEIEAEVQPTFQAHDNMSTLTVYHQRLDSLREHCRLRPRIIYRQMAEYFGLGRVIPMQIDPQGHEVTLDGISLTEGVFDGAWFSDRPLHLAVTADATTSASSYHLGWRLELWQRSADKQLTPLSEALLFDASEAKLLLSDYPMCDACTLTPVELPNPDALPSTSGDKGNSKVTRRWSASGHTLHTAPKGFSIELLDNGEVMKSIR